MPDLNITAVQQISTTTGGTIATTTAKGVAGGTVLPGQVIYADPSANNALKPALATTQYQAQNVVGIALGSASPNQPLTYAVGGDISLTTTGANTTLMSGSVYVLSASTAGNLISTAEMPASGNFISLVGAGNGIASNTSTPTFRLALTPAGAQK
jgi:hypothetical protein